MWHIRHIGMRALQAAVGYILWKTRKFSRMLKRFLRKHRIGNDAIRKKLEWMHHRMNAHAHGGLTLDSSAHMLVTIWHQCWETCEAIMVHMPLNELLEDLQKWRLGLDVACMVESKAYYEGKATLGWTAFKGFATRGTFEERVLRRANLAPSADNGHIPAAIRIAELKEKGGLKWGWEATFFWERFGEMLAIDANDWQGLHALSDEVRAWMSRA
jgi:hypothetical protein